MQSIQKRKMISKEELISIITKAYNIATLDIDPNVQDAKRIMNIYKALIENGIIMENING